jgi:hypothetical protein
MAAGYCWFSALRYFTFDKDCLNIIIFNFTVSFY